MTDFLFKTVYFPGNRTRNGKPSRITVSMPRTVNGHGISEADLTRLQSLSGRGIRHALGDPVLENLEDTAKAEGRSLSNLVLQTLLVQQREGKLADLARNDGQLTFSFEKEPGTGLGVTFRDSKRLPVHGWYPYVEGFSAQYVGDAIGRFGRPRNVYDPFGGAGTTQVVASHLGIKSFYAELNPLMRFIADSKVNAAKWARQHLSQWEKRAATFVDGLRSKSFGKRVSSIDLSPYYAAFPDRDFFEEKHLRELLAALSLADEISDKEPNIRDLLRLAIAANVVKSSHMTRRADLRRRREGEYKNRVVDVASFICSSIQTMVEDIREIPRDAVTSHWVSDDARSLPTTLESEIDLAITSPPYLNGTNYFRNTKLELWLLGFIASETELGQYRQNTVCGGINDVSSARSAAAQFDFVERVAVRLDKVAYDQRIPKMVRHYCSDMHRALSEVNRALRPGGHFVLDIGDSCFCGVHVPTHELLADLAGEAGFEHVATNVLSDRYSKDRFQLTQVELVLRKPVRRAKSNRDPLLKAIDHFGSQFPYREAPYAKRNWGHHLHSLCSYQGKLKPSIAHWLVQSFVPEGGSVLDPLGGVGTIAFEAGMLGRDATTVDKSPFAATVGKAKVNPPTKAKALAALNDLDKQMRKVRLSRSDYAAAEFGLNARVADYYHPETLKEVLKARKLFASKKTWSCEMTFVWASLLHVLHGNRPYALSRTSHPITPLNPSGPTEYRSLIDRVRSRIDTVMREPLPATFAKGNGVHADFREFAAQTKRRFDAIITSPPFPGMRFDRPNWLRLWFCGWTESSFHKESQGFLERQQTRSMDCYLDFFAACHRVAKENGLLVIHAGNSDEMPEQLIAKAKGRFRLIANVAEDVSDIEKHGLPDKTRTTAHHFLFFRKV